MGRRRGEGEGREERGREEERTEEKKRGKENTARILKNFRAQVALQPHWSHPMAGSSV